MKILIITASLNSNICNYRMYELYALSFPEMSHTLLNFGNDCTKPEGESCKAQTALTLIHK